MIGQRKVGVTHSLSMYSTREGPHHPHEVTAPQQRPNGLTREDTTSQVRPFVAPRLDSNQQPSG